jgi:hypothetical protein
LSKLNFSFFISTVLLAALLAGEAFSQNAATESKPASTLLVEQPAKFALPDQLAEVWRASKPAQAIKPAPGEQALYAEYGLRAATVRSYSNGQSKAMVEVFELFYPSGAYGLFTFKRASSPANRQEFFAGKYLVRVSVASLAAAVKAALPVEQGESPVLPQNLPEQDKVAASEIYFVGPEALAQIKSLSSLKGAVDFTGGAEAVTASYRNGNGVLTLLIVEYHTPQLATDGFAKRQSHFNSLNEAEKAQRLLKRVGNYVVEALGVSDLAAAQALVGKIKYAPKVYWEGSRLRDIPLEYRPPDPTMLEEAATTAKVIVRTFYWVGALLLGTLVLGFLTGCAVFYWRRYQRRKLGLDDLFSDAGNTIRLNLDEYLLESGKSKAKLLGKSEQR